MKTGMTLQALATEIQRQSTAKRDFVVASTVLGAHTTEEGTILTLPGSSFKTTEQAHEQLATRLKIPTAYYNRMRREQPDLLDRNINTWFSANPEKRMIRTLDGNFRAYLSDRYRRLDNFDLAQATLPVLGMVKDMKIVSCDLTPTNLYIKAVFPHVVGEVKPGDVVRGGLIIGNSEVGRGRLWVSGYYERLVCTNGMVATEETKRNHAGSRINVDDDESRELYSDETLRAADRAFWLQAQDLVKAACDPARFQPTLTRMQIAAGNKIAVALDTAVETLANKFSFSEEETDGVLKHLIAGGDTSQWGVINALTRYSQDVADYDRATDFEVFGGKVLSLAPTEWAAIAN